MLVGPRSDPMKVTERHVRSYSHVLQPTLQSLLWLYTKLIYSSYCGWIWGACYFVHKKTEHEESGSIPHHGPHILKGNQLFFVLPIHRCVKKLFTCEPPRKTVIWTHKQTNISHMLSLCFTLWLCKILSKA